MKISHIRIRNLASLAGTQPPIVLGPEGMQGGLVAVTGPTGAGKSTILDCVCLALYGDTPRLRGRGEDYNTKNILSRGADDGFAEVDFCDDQGLRYRARWEIERNRNGNLKPAQMALHCLDTQEQLARGIRDSQEHITRIIGLDRNQFVGVVLLAQGSFSTFLGGDSSDRGALLERLSGFDQYSRLGRAAHAYLAEAKAAVSNISYQLGENPLLDAAQRLELEDAIAESNQRNQAAQTRAEAAHTLAKRLGDCQQAWHNWQQAKAQSQRDHTAAQELEPQRQRLRAAERVEPLRTPLGVCDDRQQQLQQQGQQQHTLAQEQRELEEQASQQQGQLTQAMADMSQLLQQLDQLQQQATEAAPSDGEALSVAEQLWASYQDAQQIVSQSESKCGVIAQEIPPAETAWQQQQEALSQAKAVVASASTALEEQQAKLDQALAQGGDQQQRSAILHRRQQLSDWISQYHRHGQEYQEWQAQLTQLSQQAQEHRSQAEGLRARVAQQTQALEAAKRILQLAQSEAAVSEHRHSLVAGEPCPLCLQEVQHPPARDDSHHPLPQASAAVRDLEDELAQQHQQLASLEAQLQALPTRQQELEQQCQRAQQLQQELRNRYDDAAKADSALASTLAELQPEQAKELVEAAQSALAELTTLVNQRDAAKEHLHTASQKEQQADKAVHSAQSQLQSLRTHLAEREEHRKSAQEKLTNVTKELQDSLSQLGKPASDLADLSQATEWLQQLRQAWRQAQEWTGLHSRVAERYQERLHEIQAQLPAGTSLPKSESQLGQDPSQAQADLEAAGSAIKQSLQRWQTSMQDLQNTQSSIASLRHRIQQGEAELKQLQADLHAACQKHGLADVAALRAALMPADALQELRQTIDHADQACLRSASALEAAQGHLQQQAQACGEALPAIEQEDFAQQLSQAQTQAEEDLRQRQEEAETLRQELAELRAQLARDDHNRQRAGDLSQDLERAQAHQHRIEQLHQLIGSHDGSKFRDLAQAFTLEHLVHHANRRLARFAPRYALRRREGLALEVIDRDLADETRAITTLSGGESFLVSLGLALALADLKRGRAHIGAVFIDEGFGSLDSASLEHALAALADVQADLGAQLVVISHVGDLAQRWEDVVSVRRTSRGRSWLQVPGGPSQPPKDAPAIQSQGTNDMDTTAIRAWLAQQDQPQSRPAIAKALGLDNNGTLSKALKADPHIEMIGRKYTVSPDDMST